MNYYSHNIGDYAQATTHLSLVEDAIYSRLLRRYYAEERPIVDDMQQVCRWVGARSEDERAAVPLVLGEFFTLVDGYWHNKRADAEIAAYHVKAETAKANGKRGGRPRKEGGNPEKPSRFSVGSEIEPNPNQEETGSKANQETRNKKQETEEHPPTPRKRGQGFDASAIDLPDWLDREDWESWVADRRARKKPVTEEGAKRQLQQLADYLAEGHQPRAVIAHSIAGSYQGLFPPRAQARASPPTAAQRRAAWSSELRDVLAEGRERREIDMGVIDASS
ncbi:hypothetical protein A7J67_08400 [Achromobacter xylosoxidans]|nr:hypothetical protein A7J67_08400 [Achromobacter xylosoxidans]